jgi:hypothetical protein
LAYFIKGGKFGRKEDLEVNSPIAGIEAIYYIYNWYLIKYYTSWIQFRNWLKKNNPENKRAIPENKAGKDNIVIKKENKNPLLLKQFQSIQKESPERARKAEIPIKLSKL